MCNDYTHGIMELIIYVLIKFSIEKSICVPVQLFFIIAFKKL